MTVNLIEKLAIYRSEILSFIIVSSVVQFCFILLLVAYTLLYRLKANRLESMQEAKNNIWYNPLFRFLDNEIKADDFKKLVSKNDFKFFGEFIKEFFLDVEGKDKEKLTFLLNVLGFDDDLIRKLRHRNVWERLYAVYFLGLINCQKAIPELRQLIFDRSESVRLITSSILLKLKHKDSLHLIFTRLNKNSHQEHGSQIIMDLLESGPEILPELEKILRTADLEPWLMRILIDLFGHYVHLKASDKIRDIFHQTDDLELKVSCLNALAVFEDPSLVDFFEEQLEKGDFPLQVASAKALEKLGLVRSIPKLVAQVENTNFWLSKRSVEALNQMGPEGRQTLRDLVSNSLPDMTRNLIMESLNTNPEEHGLQ